MDQPIRRVAVLGAGVMGSGIAAHVANAGIPVLLLDIVPPDLKEAEKASRGARDRIAATAVAGMLKARPAPLYSPRGARLISTGNLEDDLAEGRIVEVPVAGADLHRQLRAVWPRDRPLTGAVEELLRIAVHTRPEE